MMTLDDAQTREEIITGIAEDGSFYPIEKLAAHRVSTPHRAISVFVFDGDRLVIQQRADGKYHAPGLWANTCCSHPRWGESPQACADRRLMEEMGWHVSLRQVDIIDYEAPVGALFENEKVYCFAGTLESGEALGRYNREEVQAVDRFTLPELLEDVAEKPGKYSPWFGIYMKQHAARIAAWGI